MKVLVFMSQFYQLGGAERLSVDLSIGLNKKGVESDILNLYSRDIPGVSKEEKYLLNSGVRSVKYLDLRINPSFVELLLSIFKLRQMLIEGGYDIIETSLMAPSFLASFSVIGTDVKHVAGIHQVYDVDRDRDLRSIAWKVSSYFNRRTVYYAISDFVRSKWLEYSGVNKCDVQVVYNSIQDKFFDIYCDKEMLRKQFEIPIGSFVVVYVGRIAAYKGVDVVLDALIPLILEKNAYLLYVGADDMNVPGTREIINDLHSKIDQYKIADRVKFLGYRNDIPELMCLSDVLLHPTNMEGFGLSLVEALAVGLPVITSDAEAIPEILDKTESIILPNISPEKIRCALGQIISMPCSQRESIKKKGINRASHFRNDERVVSMINLFKTLINEG